MVPLGVGAVVFVVVVGGGGNIFVGPPNDLVAQSHNKKLKRS